MVNSTSTWARFDGFTWRRSFFCFIVKRLLLLWTFLDLSRFSWLRLLSLRLWWYLSLLNWLHLWLSFLWVVFVFRLWRMLLLRDRWLSLLLNSGFWWLFRYWFSDFYRLSLNSNLLLLLQNRFLRLDLRLLHLLWLIIRYCRFWLYLDIRFDLILWLINILHPLCRLLFKLFRVNLLLHLLLMRMLLSLHLILVLRRWYPVNEMVLILNLMLVQLFNLIKDLIILAPRDLLDAQVLLLVKVLVVLVLSGGRLLGLRACDFRLLLWFWGLMGGDLRRLLLGGFWLWLFGGFFKVGDTLDILVRFRWRTLCFFS